MDRRHDGRIDKAAVREGQEVEAVVNDVELGRVLEHLGDVGAFRHFGIDVFVLRPPARGRRVERRRGQRVGGSEERHLMAEVHEAVSEQRGEQFPWAVVTRRCPPGDRCQHGDSQRRQGGVAASGRRNTPEGTDVANNSL